MQIITLENKLVNLEINPALHYGILLSGGLDSAVLLYLILIEYQSKLITPKIQAFTVNDDESSINYATEIINYVNRKFKLTLPDPIIVGDPKAHHSQIVRSGFKEIISTHRYIDFTFISLNQNPPESTTFCGLAPYRFKQSPSPELLAPFTDLIKHEIIDLIYRFDALELIDLTHTCSKHSYGRCNKCWHCNEREWAFNKLGKTDTGTN